MQDVHKERCRNAPIGGQAIMPPTTGPALSAAPTDRPRGAVVAGATAAQGRRARGAGDRPVGGNDRRMARRRQVRATKAAPHRPADLPAPRRRARRRGLRDAVRCAPDLRASGCTSVSPSARGGLPAPMRHGVALATRAANARLFDSGTPGSLRCVLRALAEWAHRPARSTPA